MKTPPRPATRTGWVVAAAAAVLVLWLVATAAVVLSTLSPPERAQVVALIEPRLALVGMAVLALAVMVGVVAQHLARRYLLPPARLLEQVSLRLATDAPAPLTPPADGGPVVRGLADAFNQMSQRQARWRDDVDLRVAEASRDIERERARLAALMSELAMSVLVCNLDGRILFYNRRARLQFRALSQVPELAGGAELIGLGRSIYAVFDRQRVTHALEQIQRRLARGADNPSVPFVTVTPGGQLLRAHVAPVRDGDVLGGFVLLLENITGDYERDVAQDKRLLSLAEDQHGAIGRLHATLERLDDADADTRRRQLALAHEGLQTMARRLNDMAAEAARQDRTRWPMEHMLGADLVAAARRRIEDRCAVRTGTLDVDPALWLHVDSFAVLQVLGYLASCLVDTFGVKVVLLRLQPAGDGRADLDLVWAGQAMSTETVMAWEAQTMQIGDRPSPLSVRDVMQRHGGAFGFERDRVRQQACFRLRLPCTDPAGDADGLATAALHHDSRPEFYDFDLFQTSPASLTFGDRSLASLSYTVFDTETTGLEPSAGDEIIQIGATRIVNGRLLRRESFEQLVDPRRSIPAAGIPIHGIRPEMVAGQPTIERVLPAFHTYVGDTVLVAHNAAFDMRFLQLKEAATGVRFDQPVLDTLLLSAVVHPHQTSHRLEAICERFGIAVIGRHTALGDALVTAEVWLRLIPLLAAQGVHTLAQAREAAQHSHLARLRY